MRTKRDASAVLNSSAGPLPTPGLGHRIPLTASKPNCIQNADTPKIFGAERAILGAETHVSADGSGKAMVNPGRQSSHLSSQASSMRQPLKMLLTMIVKPLT
jgi:hypothetical protein